MTLAYIIAAILGAGGLGTAIYNLFKGLSTVRAGARTRINDLVDDLNEARKAAEERETIVRRQLSEAMDERDKWRAAAWQYVLQLTENRIKPIPPYGQPWPSDPPQSGGTS